MSNVILTNTIKSEPWIHTITLLLNTREKKRRNNKLLHFQLKKSVHKSMKNINTIFLVFLFPRIVIINLYISFYVPEIQIWWIREATKKHINNKIHWNIEWTKSRKKNQKKKSLVNFHSDFSESIVNSFEFGKFWPHCIR